MHHFEKEGSLPSLLNATLCFLGVINSQALLVTCTLSDDISRVAEVQRLVVFSLRIEELPRDCQQNDSLCQAQSWEAGGRSGKTSGRFCSWLTVRPCLLLTGVNGSPKLSSSASGTRRTGSFCWKFYDVAVLFFIREYRKKIVDFLGYPDSLTRCLFIGLAAKL